MTDSVPETEPESQPEQQSASIGSAAPPSRSPVERAMVWGIIAVLVVIAVVETQSRFRFKLTYESLLNRIQKGEQTGKSLAAPEVVDLLKGRQSDETREVRGLVNGASRVDIYRFGGILQKRTVYVYYGTAGTKGEPEVVAVTDRESEPYVPHTTPRPGLTPEPGSSAGGGSGTMEPVGEKTKIVPAKTNQPPPTQLCIF